MTAVGFFLLGVGYVFAGLALLIAWDNRFRSIIGPILGKGGALVQGVGVMLWPLSLTIDIVATAWKHQRRNRRIGGAR